LPSDSAGSERKTVLVVDEEQALLEFFRDVIEQEGLHVVTAQDGAEALRLLESSKTPCLILLDLNISGMDAGEFRRRLLSDPRLAGIPIAGFKGLSDEEGDARRLALSSYLRNPMHLHQVLETVSHYCSDPDHLDVSHPRTTAAG
jgi:CheY-like chemotaxis protein